jgi:UDP-N-acetyl-D-glucosamine dehydrogenase
VKGTASLRRRILSRDATVGVVGQGYVGVSLASAIAEAGFTVRGVDLDPARIEDLRRGVLSVAGVDEDLFQAGLRSERMTFTAEPGGLEGLDIFVICVPTPIKDHAPDLSHVQRAASDVAGVLAPGSLVVLESTTYPGTTEQLVRPLLETSGLTAGRDFLLAYSPERIDPGNVEFGLRNTPKIVGGLTPEATGMATLFYEQLVDKVVALSSCRAAELSKLLENTFRHVNIALVNEMATLCHEMGIDVWEVVDAAATKPFGFMRFSPGPGVGGHCIPLDPAYLAWQVRRDAGHQFRILEQAQDVNAQMPGYVVGRIAEVLNDMGKPVKGARILILGVSYKPDVGDLRESPAIRVIELLQWRGAKVTFNDPYTPSVRVNGNDELPRTQLTRQMVASVDCVAILTPHSAYDLDWIASHAPLVFDAQNAYGAASHRNVIRL